MDPARLRALAEELAKLSAAISSQIEQLNHGQVSKDLGAQLKHIEKLVKHLRSEITPQPFGLALHRLPLALTYEPPPRAEISLGQLFRSALASPQVHA
jgi:hypothetical protein